MHFQHTSERILWAKALNLCFLYRAISALAGLWASLDPSASLGCAQKCLVQHWGEHVWLNLIRALRSPIWPWTKHVIVSVWCCAIH
eukprot:5163955-Amphidinium_carterae.1